MNGDALTNVLLIALTIVSWVVSIPACLFALECLLGSRRPAAIAVPQRARSWRVAVLIPAHNEADNIAATLRSVKGQMQPQDALIVVADNCTDDTAAVARAQGAQVHERQHDTLRGKGYALDHGVRALENEAPDIVIMLDADCSIHPGGVDALVNQCQQTHQPVQARYLMQASAGAPLKIKVAAMAWLIKNQVRPTATTRLGWPCHLTGSGMAFPWAVIRSAPLASGNLVEDMRLGIDLAVAGTPCSYCDQALVTSEFPSTQEGQDSQRTRWEHGHIATILEQGPRLLIQGLRQGQPRLLGMALDLCIPPLSSLVLVALAWMALTLVVGLWSKHWWPMAPVSVSLLAMTGGFLLAWHHHGKHLITAAELRSIPSYITQKLPIYLSFFTKRQVAWIRTKRDDESK